MAEKKKKIRKKKTSRTDTEWEMRYNGMREEREGMQAGRQVERMQGTINFHFQEGKVILIFPHLANLYLQKLMN